MTDLLLINATEVRRHATAEEQKAGPQTVNWLRENEAK